MTDRRPYKTRFAESEAERERLQSEVDRLTDELSSLKSACRVVAAPWELDPTTDDYINAIDAEIEAKRAIRFIRDDYVDQIKRAEKLADEWRDRFDRLLAMTSPHPTSDHT